MKNIFLVIMFLNIFFVSSQNDLTGKWAMIIPENLYSFPECMVIEITKNKLVTSSFDSIIAKSKLEIDTINKIFKQGKNKDYVEYKYSVRNKLILTHYRLSGRDNKTKTLKEVPWKYAKLLPTEVNFPVEEVIKKQYNHFYKNSFIRQVPRIKFQGVMCPEQVEIFLGSEKCDRYRLEKIDKTYFIVYQWKKGYRKWMVPIKEINKDHLLIYGVSGREEEGFIKLREIKEIKSTNPVWTKKQY